MWAAAKELPPWRLSKQQALVAVRRFPSRGFYDRHCSDGARVRAMSWQYRIDTGAISHDGLRIGAGYSGHGDGRNNPKLVAVADVGPIPPGRYAIGPAYDDPHLGPCVMRLDPLSGTEDFGRSLFRIHGDNQDDDASRGCVVLGPAARRAIAASADRVLEVVT
jgi:hypothetical protein